jgi:hypothetical protein
MSTFPGSPRLLKGALVAVDPLSPPPKVIVFQYNPDTLTRKLDARTSGGGDSADRTEALRLTGPPKETITLSIEVDAADGLEAGNPLTAAAGVAPTLAAIEMLITPGSALVTANTVLAQVGNIEIVAPEMPLTLFVWGPQRVLPVRLTSFSITEEAYDPLLNPIRAKVDLTLNVLSYYDLKITNPGYMLSLVHQISREVLAVSNTVNSAANFSVSLNF